LQTFLPLPTYIQGFANEHQLRQQQSLEAGPNDHAVIHRYAIEPPPLINRLPIELLAEIFSLTLLNHAGSWDTQRPPLFRDFPGLSFSPGLSSDPMMLAQVCRYWRCVTFTTPLLETWLERSADCPLKISFFEPFQASKENSSGWSQQNMLSTEILSLLMTHSHRWKAIDFHFSLGIPLVLANLPAGSLKILESATILHNPTSALLSQDDLPPLDKVWEAIHASPSFREGHWGFEYLENRLQNVPWARMTCIEVTMSIDSLFEALAFCHNLVDLRFTDSLLVYDTIPRAVDNQSSNRHHPRTTIVLPHLRNFSVTISQPPDAIFQRLTLPSLISFSIQQYGTSQALHNPASFHDLLARSQCRLRQYFYDDPSPDGEDNLLKILASPLLSSVVNLSVESAVTDRFLTLLIPTGLHPALPNLEKLFIGTCSSSPGALVDMISHRRLKVHGRSLLRDIEVGNWGYHEVDLKGFEALAEQEMLIDV